MVDLKSLIRSLIIPSENSRKESKSKDNLKLFYLFSCKTNLNKALITIIPVVSRIDQFHVLIF
jgi:hypothetical protein